MISLKKLILVAIGLPMALSLPACDAGDVALGAGVLAIGAGAVAIGSAANSNKHHHHQYNHHYHRPQHHGYYYGGGYNSSYGGYYRPRPRPRPWWRATSPKESIAMAAEKEAFASDWAARFDLSVTDATKLITALDQSRSGDINALIQLGLTERDLNAMSRFQLPDQTALHNLSLNLNQNPESTKEMLSTLIETAKTDLQNVNGRIWGDCQASGVWKTPQYNRCSDLKTSGCSPETGATMCVPVI